MKTTERFERAVSKLYNAFHENRLNAMDCKACAVGNICDNSDEWAHYGIFYVNGWGEIESHKNCEVLRKSTKTIQKTGYSPLELQQVEKIFLNSLREDLEVKQQQYNGLCAVVEYLAQLDNIPNPMDYSKLFETDNNEPKYQLAEIF